MKCDKGHCEPQFRNGGVIKKNTISLAQRPRGPRLEKGLGRLGATVGVLVAWRNREERGGPIGM